MQPNTYSEGLTRTEILANGQLMIAAGFETTSTAFTFLVYNLAMNPEYQDRLREEIEAAVERHDVGKFFTYILSTLKELYFFKLDSNV